MQLGRAKQHHVTQLLHCSLLQMQAGFQRAARTSQFLLVRWIDFTMSGRGKGGKVKGKAKSRANQVVLGPDLPNILGQSYDYLSFLR